MNRLGLFGGIMDSSQMFGYAMVINNHPVSFNSSSDTTVGGWFLLAIIATIVVLIVFLIREMLN